MLVNTVFFSATLTARMDKADRALPISTTDTARLVAALGEEGYTYLILRDPIGAEIIKAVNTCGGLVVSRGEDGTEPLNFPQGSCVRWEITPAGVKELICTHDCCDGVCTCDPVAAAGFTLPAGAVGVPWHGVAIFTGDTPMEVTAIGVPSWATVVVGANYITMEGVPTTSETYSIAVAATNCNGSMAVQQGSLIIKV